MESRLILDRYRPLEELGEGGYGSVVSAWDTRMQRRVAIKRLPLPLDASGLPMKRAGLSEARTAAMLNHPAIVTVYDFDTDQDEAFIIMELIDGASLDELLAEMDGPLNLDEAAAALGPVFDAVEFAHANGVLHLDLKPANVLVDRDGRVKVTDFGVSALSRPGGLDDRHGAAGSVTLGYAPLEQLSGATVGERTDEWALGVLSYEVLTAENPFAAATSAEAIARAEVFEVAVPSARVRDIPAEVDDAVMTALEPVANHRFPSVRAFGDALLPELGDAAAGRESLAEFAERFAGEDLEAEEGIGLARLGLWDRLGNRGIVLGRAAAAVVSAWLVWIGLSTIVSERVALAGAGALAALAGALAPALGTALGLIAFVIGVLASGLPWLGALLIVLAVPYWWFASRRSTAAAVLPLAAPLLAVLRLALLAPLLAGFMLPPVTAAAAGLGAGLLTTLSSALSGSRAPFLSLDPGLVTSWWLRGSDWSSVVALARDPAYWVALACWPLAAAVMSLYARRGTRLGALLGTVLASGVIWAGYTLAEYVYRTETVRVAEAVPARWTGPGFQVTAIASLILMLLVCLLGPPLRAEEDRSRSRLEPESEPELEED